jgi:plastocyanin
MRPSSLATHTVALMMLGFVTSETLFIAPKASAAGRGSEAIVTIDNFTFVLQILKVSPGTRVIWINRDASSVAAALEP